MSIPDIAINIPFHTLAFLHSPPNLCNWYGHSIHTTRTLERDNQTQILTFFDDVKTTLKIGLIVFRYACMLGLMGYIMVLCPVNFRL